MSQVSATVVGRDVPAFGTSAFRGGEGGRSSSVPPRCSPSILLGATTLAPERPDPFLLPQSRLLPRPVLTPPCPRLHPDSLSSLSRAAPPLAIAVRRIGSASPRAAAKGGRTAGAASPWHSRSRSRPVPRAGHALGSVRRSHPGPAMRSGAERRGSSAAAPPASPPPGRARSTGPDATPALPPPASNQPRVRDAGDARAQPRPLFPWSKWKKRMSMSSISAATTRKPVFDDKEDGECSSPGGTQHALRGWP